MGKYDQYITTKCVKEIDKRPGHFLSSTRHLDTFGGGELNIDCIYVVEPHLMLTQPHKHEFGQYLNFFSANPEDPRDFDADVELTLGGDETYVFSCPTSVYVPAGTLHGPLDFKRIGKPVLFLDIAATGKYARVGNTPD
jgi:hypothetical protein